MREGKGGNLGKKNREKKVKTEFSQGFVSDYTQTALKRLGRFSSRLNGGTIKHRLFLQHERGTELMYSSARQAR